MDEGEAGARLEVVGRWEKGKPVCFAIAFNQLVSNYNQQIGRKQ